jgi:hypothetical protein
MVHDWNAGDGSKDMLHTDVRIRRLNAVAPIAASAVLVSPFLVMGQPRVAASPINDCHSTDNGDPVLTSISLSPDVVDVSAGPAHVDITARASDTGGPGPASGVRSVSVEMPEAPGSDVGFRDVRLSRDGSSGTWTGSMDIPRGSGAGRLRISQAFVRDQTRQLKWYGPEDVPLSSVPGVHAITVKSLIDATPPKLTAFRFSPGSVDTTHRAKRVLVTARAHDPQSGVSSVSAVFTGPRGGHVTFADLRPVPDTADRFRGHVLISRYLPSGRWRVAGVAVVNGAGGFTWIPYSRLGRLGFKRSLEVVSRLDRRAPSLHNLRRTPAALDVRTRDQLVTVTARLRDVGAGIRWADATFDGRGRTPTIPLHLVAGTRHDGTWRGQVSVSRCHATAGAWKITVEAEDKRGNYSFWSARRLARRSLPTVVRVKAMPPATPPHVKVARYFVHPTGRIKLVFARAISGLDTTSAPVHRLTGDFDPDGAPSAGKWTCFDKTAAVASCTTGRVRTALFRPDSPFTPGRDYDVELNPEHTLQISDVRGNPYDRDIENFHVEAK